LENLVVIAFCCFISIKTAKYLFVTGKILRRGVLAEGRVIGCEEKMYLFTRISCPVIEFKTNSGKQIKGVFKPIWVTRKFPKEEKVMVVYDPSKPNRFFVDNRYIDIANFALLSLSVSALLLTLYRWTAF